MAENSAIAWTHHTFNPWWGCSRVSPGCEHCYAEQLATVRRKLPVWGVNADRKPMSEAYWRQPIKWNRDAKRAGERRRVFCASMADVFEVLRGQPGLTMAIARLRLCSLIEQTPWLDWLLLTKRPENVLKLVPWGCSGDAKHLRPWPSNVWLGVTAEDQRRADERIPILLSIPARVRFVSYEPALGLVDFSEALKSRTRAVHDPGVDWIIVGGESGSKARPFDLAWARSTVRQCHAAGVACFVKQMGSNTVRGPSGAPDDGGDRFEWADPKGGDPSEWPEDLRVREFPR